MKIDYKKQGKRNLEKGRRFEVKVYKDLEAKKWICARWTKNVDLKKDKLIPAKQGRFRKVSTGFPDYIIFRSWANANDRLREVIGVECKSNGYLTKEEKEKARWYLENNVFPKFIIASKGKKRGTIKYKEFKTNGNKKSSNL